VAAQEPVALGELLKRYRIAAGLTQEELAERAGVSARSISDLERGLQRTPYPSTVRRLAEALQLGAEERTIFQTLGAGHRDDATGRGVVHLFPTQQPPPTNLPVTESTPFIGREREIGAIVSRVRREEVRLVTLTGPGGCGKTRLAVQAAGDLLDAFPDGVFFVALASLVDPALVVSTIASTLGLQETRGTPLDETLAGYLRAKRLLLVLDNFEHLLGATSVVVHLLSTCPCLKLVVTSRTVLRLSAEHEYPVPTLSMPDAERVRDPDSLLRYDAVALFVQRARASRPDFGLTHENAPTVVEICRRLDGLPLAIELAAGRVKLFPPRALLQRLSNRLALLTGGARDVPLRQLTLRGTLDWSFNLLEPGEKILFRRLAVFAGGCTLEAVEAVCDLHGDVGIDVLEGIQSLLDKSLVRQEGEQEPRLVMLDTIRDYALEQLLLADNAPAVRARHLDYFVTLAEAAEPQFSGPEQLTWYNRLEQEHDNLRAALEWARSSGDIDAGLRLAGAAAWFWYVRGHWTEGRAWLEAMLSRPEAAAKATTRQRALVQAGLLAHVMGDETVGDARVQESITLGRDLRPAGNHFLAIALAQQALFLLGRDAEGARQLVAESLVISRDMQDRSVIALGLYCLGEVALQQRDYREAQARFEESLAAFREVGDRLFFAGVFAALGMLHYRQGEYDAARAHLEDALTIMRACGVKGDLLQYLYYLGQVAVGQGEVERAKACFAEGLGLARERGDAAFVGLCLQGFAEIAEAGGQLDRAARLFGAAEAQVEESGGIRGRFVDLTTFQRDLHTARARLQGATLDAAWTAGRHMSLPQAVEDALLVDPVS
jgi:predicted ATPase/DNA-binding XRE family transcriptional regulator